MQSFRTCFQAKAFLLMLAFVLIGSLKLVAQQDSWVLQPKPNVGPSGVGFTITIGAKAYSMGAATTKQFWEYDPSTGAWSQKADFGGIARQYPSGFSIGNKGYIGLGIKGINATDVLKDFWEYDQPSNSWTQKADYVGVRYYPFAFAINGKGYFAGGQDWYSVYADCNEYDPVTNVWTRKANNTNLLGGVSFVIGDKAYIGIAATNPYWYDYNDKYSNEFWEFDPAKNTYRRLTDFPGSKRVFGEAFTSGGKGYVTLGFNAANDVWQYDPIGDKWSRKTDIPGNGTFVATVQDKGYVGGSNIYRYDVQTTAPVKVLFTGNTFVNLDWENFNTANPIVAYDIFVNGVKTYTTTESAVTADKLLPNTSYTFTITGRDSTGVSTAATDPVTVTTNGTSSGLNYRYYEGSWDQLPDFNTVTPVKSGLSTNVDLSTRTAGLNDHFGFVWEGNLTVPTPGQYKFETVSDDGSRFYFNSFYNPAVNPLINNDGIHDPWTPVSASVNIPAAGQYPVAISYFEKDGGAAVQLYWTGPTGSGITRQLVPAAAFSGNYTPLTDSVAPGAPANLKALITAKTFVNLDWDDATDNMGVAFYDVYINGTKKYSTTVSEIKIDSLTEGSAYTFSVKARDIAGNISAFSNTLNLTATNTNTGLNYRYYQGNWNTLPDFNALTPVKTGIAANVDISIRPSTVNDYFGFVWEGTINIPFPGTYTFETLSDDGSRIYFNSLFSLTKTPTVNNDGVHGAYNPVAGTVNVPAAGQYPIAITYFEKDSHESVQVYWTGPVGSGINRQLIPDYAFKGNYVPPADTIPPTVPTNLKALTVSRNSVALDWDNSSDNVGVAFYDVYLNGVKKYSTNVSEIIADSLLDNTAYTFSIKARDVAGNLSAFSNLISVTTSGSTNGLNYRYYEGDWNSLPDFNSLTPVKKGISPNVDISLRNTGVNDHFGFVWEGSINIITPGKYTFETISDDGSKLYFNSSYSADSIPLINNDGVHGPITAVTGSVNINTPGRYPIALAYFEKDGGESIQVYWTGPAGSGINRQLIPDAAFKGDLFNSADTIQPSAPANLKVLLSSKNKISLDWDNSTDNVGVAYYDVYLSGIKKYTTTISELVMDSLQPGTLYSITVKARDVAGNTSAPSVTLTTTTTRTDNGFNYRYYEGNWDILPDFNALTPVKTGLSSNIDISIRPAGINDHFGFVWEGSINIPVPGTYTFETVSDDGSRLYFNTTYSASAAPLVNNDGVHGPYTPVAATVNIPATGKYPFAISYFEKDGGESMQVYWTGPAGSGITRQLIPDSAFSSSYLTLLDSIPPPAPANFTVTGRNATALKLAWNNMLAQKDVMRYDIYLNGIKKYSTHDITIVADSLAPNTVYTLKAKAIDSAGNSSPFSNEVTAQTLFTTDGLDYKYYEGNWDVLPDFSKLTPVKQGTTPNADISIRPAGTDDHFGFVWTGYIKFPGRGLYTFEMISDDGSSLVIDNIPIINNDGLHAATSKKGTADIADGGVYPVSISYFEKDGDQKLQLNWIGPGMDWQPVPSSAFVRYVPGVSFVQGSNMIVNSLNVTADASSTAGDLQQVKMYPNPFYESFQVSFYNSSALNKIAVGVYDLTGRLILNQKMVSLPAGKNAVNVQLNNRSLPAGTYIVKLQVNSKTAKTYKMIKVRK